MKDKSGQQNIREREKGRKQHILCGCVATFNKVAVSFLDNDVLKGVAITNLFAFVDVCVLFTIPISRTEAN